MNAVRQSFCWTVADFFSFIAVQCVAEYHLSVQAKVPSPAILIASHRSMFDVPAGLMTFRRLGVKPLIVVSQRQLESIRLGRLKWRGVGVLPIASGAEGRRTLIQAGCGALAAGQSVALMPEGRVIREGFSSSSVRSGAAHLAVESGASVIVLGSAGSERFWRRGSLASFVAVRRSPVVVVCHTSIQPTDDVEFMKQSIVVSMAEAERSAREILHGIAAGS